MVLNVNNDTLLSESYIKQLHKVFCVFIDDNNKDKGNYRTEANQIIEFNDSNNGLIFKTSDPYDIPELMKKLVKWTNDSFKKNIHPLIIIALFVFHFLLISPFASENIYIVNALIVFLMLKNGYTYVPYFSLDLMFQQNMKKYKIVLIKRDCQ